MEKVIKGIPAKLVCEKGDQFCYKCLFHLDSAGCWEAGQECVSLDGHWEKIEPNTEEPNDGKSN